MAFNTMRRVGVHGFTWNNKILSIMFFYEGNFSMSVFKKGALGVLLMMATSVSCSSQAVLLVSLGMPDNALIAYLKQAHQYHIPLVIRGLYTDKNTKTENVYIGSFEDTANRVKKLVQKSKVGGVSINPLSFRAFGIKAVPALVVYDDGLSCIQKTAHTPNTLCNKNTYDVVYGNIPIYKQLAIISDQSPSHERADFSKLILEKYSTRGESE